MYDRLPERCVRSAVYRLLLMYIALNFCEYKAKKPSHFAQASTFVTNLECFFAKIDYLEMFFWVLKNIFCMSPVPIESYQSSVLVYSNVHIHIQSSILERRLKSELWHLYSLSFHYGIKYFDTIFCILRSNVWSFKMAICK